MIHSYSFKFELYNTLDSINMRSKLVYPSASDMLCYKARSVLSCLIFNYPNTPDGIAVVAAEYNGLSLNVKQASVLRQYYGLNVKDVMM